MKAIVDVQGFKRDNNEFILKEIAIICNDQVQVLLFKPPFPFYDLTKTERRQVSWIERNRRILWNAGVIPYYKNEIYIKELLRNKTIYTKGLEKILWLKYITGNNDVFNLEDKNCPSLLHLYNEYKTSNDVFCCMYHPTICALKNVTCLKKWCNDNINNII